MDVHLWKVETVVNMMEIGTSTLLSNAKDGPHNRELTINNTFILVHVR
jgi:hypothetical protein